MVTAKLHASATEVLSFDGQVLEVFHGTNSQRVHISLIKSVELSVDRKGNHEMRVETVVGPIPYLMVDAAGVPKANQAVAEIQKAMATFKFE